MKHISVCVCTYKRPSFLVRLLEALRDQDTDGAFSYSIVVVDNDRSHSAEPIVLDFAARSLIPIKYCVEPQQNIPLARNKAVENAEGDFIAFIDDDEFPSKGWLLTLFKICDERGVDGVQGPVICHFDVKPPTWLVNGHFYQRPAYTTGIVLDWAKGRTNNVLVRKQVFDNVAGPFKPEFRTGEDQDFFRRAIEKGHVFIWCNEAVVYETIPPTRWKRSVMLRRALLRGATSLFSPSFGAADIAKSVVAVLAYGVALPFSLVCGQGKFMSLLVSLCDHLGKILAVMGINPISEPYVTD